MSTCPNKDLHSVYLDNEMPEIYKAEYEAHIKDCPKCQKELAQIKALQNLLRTDSAEITPDTHYLDQSWERLQVKMKYNSNVLKANKSSKKIKVNHIVYFGMAAAAAAVFALIIPIRVAGSKNSAGGAYSVAASANMMPGFNNMAGAGGIAGNMGAVSASNVALNGNESGAGLDSGKTVIISGNIDKSVLTYDNSGRVNNSGVIQNVSTGSRTGQMGNVEVFRPDFNEGKTIYIKITLPGMEAAQNQ